MNSKLQTPERLLPPEALVRFVIADDHAMVRHGIELLLTAEPPLTCVGRGSSGDDALELAYTLRPDLLLLDLNMPGRSVLDLLRHLRKMLPQIRLIVLSMYGTQLAIAESIKAGAHGFIPKDTDSRLLKDTILRVAAGEENVFPGKISMDTDTLTDREKDIFRAVAEGLSTHEISDRFNLSEKTIEMYRTRLLRKFGLTKSTELVRLALESGVLMPAESRRP